MRKFIEIHRYMNTGTLIKIRGHFSRKGCLVKGHSLRGKEAKGIVVSTTKSSALNNLGYLLRAKSQRYLAMSRLIALIYHRPLMQPKAGVKGWTLRYTA